MTGMQLADKMLLHQVHPAKITADVTAAVISNVLLWKARPRAALAVRILLPVTSSLAVLGLADLEALAAAGLTAGRRVTCYEHVRVEAENGGGTYVTEQTVRDGRVVTAQTWQSHPMFYREIFALLRDRADAARS